MVQSSYSTPSNLLKEAIIHTKTYTLFLKAKNYPDIPFVVEWISQMWYI